MIGRISGKNLQMQNLHATYYRLTFRENIENDNIYIILQLITKFLDNDRNNGLY